MTHDLRRSADDPVFFEAEGVPNTADRVRAPKTTPRADPRHAAVRGVLRQLAAERRRDLQEMPALNLWKDVARKLPEN